MNHPVQRGVPDCLRKRRRRSTRRWGRRNWGWGGGRRPCRCRGRACARSHTGCSAPRGTLMKDWSELCSQILSIQYTMWWWSQFLNFSRNHFTTVFGKRCVNSTLQPEVVRRRDHATVGSELLPNPVHTGWTNETKAANAAYQIYRVTMVIID